MANKKDLTGAIHTGIDKFFSANDAKEAQHTQEVPKAEEAQQAHKADEVPQDQLTADIKAMQDLTEAAEARKTQGRKGMKLQRLNISLTPSEYDYVTTMAGLTGKSLTRFIGDLISREAEANSEAYKAAKELIKNVR